MNWVQNGLLYWCLKRTDRRRVFCTVSVTVLVFVTGLLIFGVSYAVLLKSCSVQICCFCLSNKKQGYRSKFNSFHRKTVFLLIKQCSIFLRNLWQLALVCDTKCLLVAVWTGCISDWTSVQSMYWRINARAIEYIIFWDRLMHVHCTTFSLSLPPTPQNKTTIAEIRTKQTCIYTADVFGILILYR